MKLYEDYFEMTHDSGKIILPLILIFILGIVIWHIVDYITDDNMLPLISSMIFLLSVSVFLLILVTIKNRRM